MRHVSGVEGAGQIWRRLMNEVTSGGSLAPKEPEGLKHVKICAVSGMRSGPDCDGGRDEIFVAGTEPRDTCAWHRHTRIDPQNGLLVPDECPLEQAQERTVTVYPSPYDAWAVETGHGIAERYTPRCPHPPAKYPKAHVMLMSPARTETLSLDVDAPREVQALPLQARVDAAAGAVTFLVDAKPFITVEAPHKAFWPLEKGEHKFQARLEATGTLSDIHDVVVR
jgi:penicillin-binding protein 1C